MPFGNICNLRNVCKYSFYKRENFPQVEFVESASNIPLFFLKDEPHSSGIPEINESEKRGYLNA